MGYTHYWEIKNDISLEHFKQLQLAAVKIVEASDVFVMFGINTHPLHLNIIVEGINEGAHETFCLSPNTVKFEFCKTARKPYDEIVVAILYHAHVMRLLEFSSDGNEEDLTVGKALARRNKSTVNRNGLQLWQDAWGGTGDTCQQCDAPITEGGAWGLCPKCEAVEFGDGSIS